MDDDDSKVEDLRQHVPYLRVSHLHLNVEYHELVVNVSIEL